MFDRVVAKSDATTRRDRFVKESGSKVAVEYRTVYSRG